MLSALRLGSESERGDTSCEFRCKNSGECITEDRLCDGVDDCGDREDEELDQCEEGNVYFFRLVTMVRLLLYGIRVIFNINC
jgi:Low-density lipoprotein receptor domain class A